MPKPNTSTQFLCIVIGIIIGVVACGAIALVSSIKAPSQISVPAQNQSNQTTLTNQSFTIQAAKPIELAKGVAEVNTSYYSYQFSDPYVLNIQTHNPENIYNLMVLYTNCTGYYFKTNTDFAIPEIYRENFIENSSTHVFPITFPITGFGLGGSYNMSVYNSQNQTCGGTIRFIKGN